MTEPTCDEFKDLSAELALGILQGRERAEAIAHLEHCPACHEELLLMGDMADRIVSLTPSAEPPPGFETRVLAALSPTATSMPAETSAAVVPMRRPRRRGPVRLILAAAVVAVAIGVGGWAIGKAGDNGSSNNSGVVTASFVTHGQNVGQVIESQHHGDPWVSMAVNGDLGTRTVICELSQSNGKTVTVGSFTLHGGYGFWGAAVPATASHVVGAKLMDPNGHTIATASFD